MKSKKRTNKILLCVFLVFYVINFMNFKLEISPKLKIFNINNLILFCIDCIKNFI